MSNDKDIVLETPRLILREMTPEDAASAFEMNSDPDVLRYTGDVPFTDVEDARNFLVAYDHYRKYGFGRWAVIRKEDGAWMGFCGLKYTPDHHEYDVGYRLMKKYWGQGYATEAATASVLAGIERFGLTRIVGRVMRNNHASIKVLEKSGLSFESEIPYSHDCDLLYSVSITSG